MKKKNIIPIIVAIVVLIIVTIFVLFKKNEPATIITLDINPSIEITLDKDNNVIDIKAMNDDAKIIVDDSYKGKNLNKTFDIIIKKLKDNGFVDENELDVILYVDGKLNSSDIEGSIFESFNKNDVNPYIIKIDKVTKEDKKLAKKYNISPAKASYINYLIKENKKLSIDKLLDKPVKELMEMKETGKYCNEGYTLEGSWCIKEKNRVSAKKGRVCPKDYYDVDGICYKEGKTIDTGKLKCRAEYTLVEEECIKNEEIEPIPNEVTCTEGKKMTKDELGLSRIESKEVNQIICVDLSNAKEPTQRCLTINHTMIDGECADGPKPTINGGCESGDYLVNGGCYTKDNKDQWICTDGGIYHKSQNSVPKYCPETIKFYDPVIVSYKCENGYELKNSKCIKEYREGPEREKTCEDGYELANDRCINKKDTANHIEGYVCDDEESRIEKNQCIIYERIEAKYN